MTETMILALPENATADYREAYSLHVAILRAGEEAGVAFALFCERLKSMRDSKAFEVLGLATFDDYCERCLAVKARMAYNYINAYERLGVQFITDNAALGITKLSLLAALPETVRDELPEDELRDMTVAEVKALIAEKTELSEQISLLEDSVTELRAKNRELEARPIEAVVDTAETQKLRKELEKTKADLASAEKKREQAQAAEAKARASAEESIKKRLKEAEESAARAARKQAEEESAERLKAAEREKNAALERAEQAAKQLAVSDKASVEVLIRFETFSTSWGELISALGRVTDEAQRKKLAGALSAALGKMSAEADALHK